MAKEIQLTQGKVALVSETNPRYVEALRYKWSAVFNRGIWYAVRSYGTRKTKKQTSLHRFLTNAPSGMFVDHIDGDGLNCTDENMRVCTNAENLMNRGKQVNNTSGFKGVTWNKNAHKWKSRITSGGKERHLGYFLDPVDAALAYDAAAVELHGEFANTNF